MRGAGNRGRPRRDKGATAGAGAGGKAGRRDGPGGARPGWGRAVRGGAPQVETGASAPGTPARRGGRGGRRRGRGRGGRRATDLRAARRPRQEPAARRGGAQPIAGIDTPGPTRRASGHHTSRKRDLRRQPAPNRTVLTTLRRKGGRIGGIPKTGGHPINRDLGIRPQTPAGCGERRRKVVETVRNGPNEPRLAPSTRAPARLAPSTPGTRASRRLGAERAAPSTPDTQHLHARAPGQLGAGRPRCPRPSRYSAASATGGSPPASSASSCASSSTGTPSATALSYFDPAASPATT